MKYMLIEVMEREISEPEYFDTHDAAHDEMCRRVAEVYDIVTYRGDDLPLLMSIRKGDYQLEDGTYRPEFFEMVSDFCYTGRS